VPSSETLTRTAGESDSGLSVVRLGQLLSAALAIAAASTPASTTTTVLTWLCFVDRQATASVLMIVQGVDSRQGLGVDLHLDEAKPATSACLPIDDHLCASDLAKWGEQVFQVGISDGKGKIADI
jgi:hypothetical protein